MTEREQILEEELKGMLCQFGDNFALSAVRDACKVVNHPRTEWDGAENDCCYCRLVVYSSKEKERRIKEKIPFKDRVTIARPQEKHVNN